VFLEAQDRLIKRLVRDSGNDATVEGSCRTSVLSRKAVQQRDHLLLVALPVLAVLPGRDMSSDSSSKRHGISFAETPD